MIIRIIIKLNLFIILLCRVSEFNEVLLKDEINIDELRRLCFNGKYIVQKKIMYVAITRIIIYI